MIKRKKLWKILISGFLTVCILVSTATNILAVNYDGSTLNWDQYRGSFPNANHYDYQPQTGSGVEYNGLHIHNGVNTDTVWAKPNDILGITAWSYQDGTAPPSAVAQSYLSIYNNNGVQTSWWMPQWTGTSKINGDQSPPSLHTDMSSSDVNVNKGRTGGTIVDGSTLHYGACFWAQFASNTDGRSYNIKSNAYSFNGSWIALQGSYVQWPESNETIKIDGTAPDIKFAPNEQTAANPTDSLNVGLNINDFKIGSTTEFGSGIQRYSYKVLKDGIKIKDSGDIFPEGTKIHSDPTIFDGSPFIDSTNLYNPVSGQYTVSTDTEANEIDYSKNSMSDTVILSGGGTYQIEVTAFDNLGNKSVKTSGDYVIPGSLPGNEEPSGAGKGKIIFTPNSTPWTNTGKPNGFPVAVTTTNQTPTETWTQHYTVTATTTTTTTDADGHESTSTSTSTQDVTVPFQVHYQLGSISLSGNEFPSSLPYNGGTIYIKEGANSIINGTASYSIASKDTPVAPTYSDTSDTTYSVSLGAIDKPSGCIENDPGISGTSGSYNVDFTDPTLSINNPSSLWVNHVVNVNVNAADPPGKYNPTGQSGLSKALWSKTDSSHYGKTSLSNNFLSSMGALASSTTVSLDDGIYSMKADDLDSATNSGGTGNSNTLSKSTYYVDTTPGTASFSVAPGIFEGAGAVRKPSVKGTEDGFYGTLTLQDNLSGVANAQYCWTFGSSDLGGSYSSIYSSPYTYTDRYQEKINLEIEKPVGDNLYLHVKQWDTAGNYTYSTFGPFEDSIKLKNFEVTDVRDPAWNEVFWKDRSFTQPTGKTYKANELPIDKNSNPIYSNAPIKKGYAFFFDITSEYLYRDQDRIEVKPFFYYTTDGTDRIPVDCYYNFNDNPFTLIGSSADTLRLNLDTSKYGSVLLGGLSKLTLTKGVRIVRGNEFYGAGGWQNKIQYSDGKTQWWYGKYYIPANGIFVKHGDIPTPDKVLSGGNIIVNFQIIGYKNGIETLSQDQMHNYVLNNWKAEGGPKNANYQEGDVMVYDNDKSLLDDYVARIIQ